jgi:biopolymer transport protein ExbD
MGGVTEAPAKGGKKSLNVELNLVPFIDLMTVCVTFLLLTAVWSQTNRISIDQSVAKPQKQEQKEPPKRLIVMLDRTGYSVKWADERPEPLPMVGGKYNREALKAKLKDLKEKLPKDQKVMVAPEDSVAYDDMIGAMDVCNQVGLPNIMVADAASVASEMM